MRRATVSAPGFIGREAELAAVAGALGAPPAVVLVEGEAGIGKSRLVQEYLAASSGRARRCLMAACPPYRQPSTLGPVVDALRQVVDGVAGLGLSGLAGALRPLFPEWAADLPATPESLEDASAARHRLFRALDELLGRLDMGLLIVEDVHWADDATLEFLLLLASAQPPRVSLLVTYRPEDVPAGSLLLRLSSRLPAGTTRARIRLGPLDAAATAALVSSMLDGEPVSGEFAAFLHARTDGLPLALEESVRLMHERADLVHRRGEWVRRRRLDDIDVPPTVRDAVLERTGRLGDAAQRVLQAAAVVTDPVSEVTLSAVSGLAVGRVRAGVADALACGLLAEDERDLMSFRHALVARAVYEETPLLARREMHLRAGRALEGAAPLPVARLARHFREAGETAKWAQYAEQAADLALTAGDDKSAAALLQDLLAHADLPTDCVVRLARKTPFFSLDGYAPLSEFAHALQQILRRPGLTSAQSAEVGSRLGRILMAMGDWQAGATELEHAVPGLAHKPVEFANAMILLSWPTQTRWPVQVHRRWLDRAAAAATDSSIPETDRLLLAVNRVTALLLMGDESGWAAAASLPDDAGTWREVLHIASGYLNTGDAAMRWGRYEEARQRLTAALQLAGQYHYTRMNDAALTTLTHLDWFTGSWDSLAGHAASLAHLDDLEPRARLEAKLVTGLLDLATGARDSGKQKLQLILEEGRRSGGMDLLLEPVSALARLHVAEGHPEDALDLTDEPMQIITAKGIWLWATEVAQARLLALTAAGRRGESAQLVMAFAEGLQGRDMPAPRAALAVCRAALAESEGAHGRAAGLFGLAAAAWAVLPRPYDALLAREQQACCLLAAGQQDAGLALLADVHQGLSGLGAAAGADRVAHVLREHGAAAWRGWRGGRRSYGDELSPREREVVQMLVAGRTSREIAQVLCRSVKTVDTQLKSAMRKLNVSTRAALAVRAVEAGVAADGPRRGAAEGTSEII
jgi:DNA-binding CsgD family transcriptional regulator/tetratricopeptide (TPR) repeat protein